jgi:peptidyl-prolyl cis-trans isomerase C
LLLGCLIVWLSPVTPGAAETTPSASDQIAPILPPTFLSQPEVSPVLGAGAGPEVMQSERLEELSKELDKTPDVVVAEVAGTPITLAMVAEGIRNLPPAWGAGQPRQVFDFVLSDLINMRMLALKAKQLGIDKDPIAKQRLSVAADRELATVLIRNVTDPQVTDKALQEQYDKDFANKPGPEEVWLRVVGAVSKTAALEALNKLNSGADFPSVVADFSHDPSKDVGGDLGYVTAESLSPALRSVAFALQPGQISAYPLESNGLWYIMEIEGRRQRPAPALKDVVPQLKQEISFKAARDYVVKTQRSTDIKKYGAAGAGAGTDPATAKPSQ